MISCPRMFFRLLPVVAGLVAVLPQAARAGYMTGDYDRVGMMGWGGGLGFGLMSVFGWAWVIIWTVNSVLVGMVLWALVKKLTKK